MAKICQLSTFSPPPKNTNKLTNHENDAKMKNTVIILGISSIKMIVANFYMFGILLVLSI